MSNDLQFEEQQINSISARRARFNQKKSFAEKVVAWGLAKDTAQANLYLIGFVVIGFAIIIYINMRTFSSPAPVDIPDDTMVGAEVRM